MNKSSENREKYRREYKAKKYMVAQFESGDQELEDITGALLVYNRKRSAQLEIEREKQQGIAMNM